MVITSQSQPDQNIDYAELEKTFSYPIKTSIQTSGEEADSFMWLATVPLGCIVFIPGNPGIIDYYESFLGELYAKLNKRYHVIGNSHLGFSRRCTKLYNLQDQIDFHGSCIKKLKNTFKVPLYFVSHSMGCYVIQKVIQNNTEVSFVKSILLFPAIHKLEHTKNGVWMSKYVFAFPNRVILSRVAKLVALLPTVLLLFIIINLAKVSRSCAKITIEKFLHILDNVFYLSIDEMDKIGEINYTFYDENIKKTIIYFGQNDGWVMDQFPLEVKKRYGNQANIILCSKNVPHSYVVDHSEIMADLVSSWLTAN